MKMLFSLLFCLFATRAFAVSEHMTVSGRIVSSSGDPLTYSATGFIFQILSPDGSCIIYEEQISGVDMTNSSGIFDLQLGTGVQNFPSTSSGLNLKSAFDNSQTVTCKATNTYSPATTDGRLLLIQVYDGSTWSSFSTTPITSVPQAMYASSSEKLGSNSAADFLLKSNIPSCSTNTYLTSTSGTLSCSTPTSSGLTSLSVTTPLTSTGGTAPTLAISQASSTSNGYLSSTDWTTFNSKMTSSLPSGKIWIGNTSDAAAEASLTGDATLSNTGSLTINKIQSQSIDATPATGGFLKWNALTSKWAASAFPSCLSNQTPYFNSASDKILCQPIDVSDSFFENGGNGFGASATLGTLDFYSLSFMTGGITAVTIDTTGYTGFGNTAPRAMVDVNGTFLMKTATNNTGSTINFANGNLQYTNSSCGNFTLLNMKDGGSYTLAVKGTTSATCTFSASSFTMHMPADHTATTSGFHTLYTFLVIGNDVYATWMPGM